MKERIRELAGQAEMFANKGDHVDVKIMMEKFAELIVRECCDILQTETIMHDGYGYNQGFLHKKIKEHFGVEE